MTTRRLNFTGCKRIKRADVEIATLPEGGLSAFVAWYDLSSYELPATAQVVVEAYVDWTLMRFAFGTVGLRIDPESTELSEFPVSDGVRFRLKVLGTGDQAGQILAEADKLQPVEVQNTAATRSFVTVRPSDLGSVVWRLTFDEAQPVLHVNERLGDWQSFLRRQSIRSLLLPEVVRQVLREALQRDSDEEDATGWESHAIRLASPATGSVPDWEDDDERERWIDDVVRDFADRHRLWRGTGELLDGDED